MRRNRLLLSLTLGLLLALTVAQGAFASSLGIRLQPGQTACITDYASYSDDAQGTATNNGARFTVYYGGIQIYQTGNNTSGFHAVFSTSYGNFPGPGYYRLCATNTGTTNTNVNLSQYAY